MHATFLSVPYQQLEMIKKQITQASGMAAHSSVSCEAGPRGAAERSSRAAGNDKTILHRSCIQLLGDADQLFVQSTYAKATKDGLVNFLPFFSFLSLFSVWSRVPPEPSSQTVTLCPLLYLWTPMFALRAYDFNSLLNNGSCCLQTVKKPSLSALIFKKKKKKPSL